MQSSVASSIKGVLAPIVLWWLWHYFKQQQANPFSQFLFILHKVAGSTDNNPLYQKGYSVSISLVHKTLLLIVFQDLAFLAYYVVVFSFIRQFINIHVFQRFAIWWGVRSSSKIIRFGEQGYAMVYFEDGVL